MVAEEDEEKGLTREAEAPFELRPVQVRRGSRLAEEEEEEEDEGSEYFVRRTDEYQERPSGMRRSVAESERMAQPPRLSGNYMGISRLSTTELLERGEDEYEEAEDEKEDEEQFLFRLESEVGGVA